MAPVIDSLTWTRTFPNVMRDFILVRARQDDDPETIGRVLFAERYAGISDRDGWAWSLTCYDRPVGIERPIGATSGTEMTRQAACDALTAAWRREDAWRAEIRARPDFESLPLYTRAFAIHGQPTPPWRKVEIAREREADQLR